MCAHVICMRSNAECALRACRSSARVVDFVCTQLYIHMRVGWFVMVLELGGLPCSGVLPVRRGAFDADKPLRTPFPKIPLPEERETCPPQRTGRRPLTPPSSVATARPIGEDFTCRRLHHRHAPCVSDAMGGRGNSRGPGKGAIQRSDIQRSDIQRSADHFPATYVCMNLYELSARP